MKLILKKDVDNLGDAGDIVQVKAGYGRNYLIPQGLAYMASEANIEKLEAEHARAKEEARRQRLEASRRAAQIEALVLTFQERAGDDGKLFGSVSEADIVDRANASGELDFELERRTVALDEPIKSLGTVSVPVKLHPEVEAEIEVRVEPVEG